MSSAYAAMMLSLHLTYVNLLNAINPQLSADAFCEKSFINSVYCDEVMPTCFRGPVFETQCICMSNLKNDTAATCL